jgi:hypothetical protein
LPKEPRYALKPGHPTPGRSNLLRPPIASLVGTGILTCFPSTTHFCLALGADSPCADERCAGNLGLTATRPFTLFIATHVSIRTSDTSSSPYELPSQAYGTLSYRVSNPLKSLCVATNISTHTTRCSTRATSATRSLSRELWPRPRRKPPLNFRERKLASSKRSRVRGDAATQFDLRWIAHTPSFGYRLEPRKSSAQDDSISELLRFL